jgi:hypothetical protein
LVKTFLVEEGLVPGNAYTAGCFSR